MSEDAPAERDSTAEEHGWAELVELIERMPADSATEPGYFREGWSAKDVVGHLGAWMAQAGVAIERIRAGTYTAAEIDIDRLNQEFLDKLRDVPFDIVRLQAWSARSQMRRQYFSLPPDPPEEATWWIRKAGAEHYAEHLPRLREWVAELRSR